MNDDHEKRLTRVEHVLFGADDDVSKSLVNRFMITESIAIELKSYAVKIVALLIIGILTAVMNLVISSRPVSSGPSTQSTSVITSDASRAAQSASTSGSSRREWLTTADVARNESVSERTVVEWIASNLIAPPPDRDGKSWRISPEYRRLPRPAEISGISPQAADPAEASEAIH